MVGLARAGCHRVQNAAITTAAFARMIVRPYRVRSSSAGRLTRGGEHGYKRPRSPRHLPAVNRLPSRVLACHSGMLANAQARATRYGLNAYTVPAPFAPPPIVVP